MGVKSLLRPIYHSYLSLRHKGRAERIVRDYANHYRRAREIYHADGNVPELAVSSLSEVLVDTCESEQGTSSIFDLEPEYFQAVDQLAKSVDEQLAYPENYRLFPPVRLVAMPSSTSEMDEVRTGSVIAVQLKSYLRVDGLREVIGLLIPQVERRVYGCYVIVDRVYIYRNIVSRLPDQVSWRWHYDNHPPGLLKIMIYLTDVGDSNGPFEYLRSRTTGQALRMATAPLLGVNITSRKLTKFKGLGYEPWKVTGRRGTVTLFDENVIHKANVAKQGYRDVVVLQVRPSSFRPPFPLDAAWTGSFEHVDFNQDPFSYELEPKTTAHRSY